jgi:hypothetical protein
MVSPLVRWTVLDMPLLWLACLSLPQRQLDFPTALAEWVATSPPVKGGGLQRWLEANHDTEHHWVVFLENAVPRVRLREKDRLFQIQEHPPQIPFRIKPGFARAGLFGEVFAAPVLDGWIIAFNAGEFGAGLWWYSPDGRTRYKISSDQVVGFFETPRGLLALEGLTHMFLSRGRLIHLLRGPDGKWQSEPVLDLKGGPETGALDVDGSLVVATGDCLLRVHPATKRYDVILCHAFWGGLYPTSMIITPAGDIYIGMRHGVARITRKGTSYRLHWLLPTKAVAGQEPKDGKAQI